MSSWLPSLNALRAFEAVSRHLNYRKAAEELNVTPAAANQLVSKLEDAIGAPLLEKKGRGLVLTPIGAAGREGLALPFRQIEDTVERLRMMSNTERLIVSTSPSFGTSWLVPRIDSFRQENPGVDVLIDSTVQVVQVERAAADVGIRFGVKDHGGLVVQRLFDEELCALCSPALAAGPPQITRVEDLANAKLLRWDLSSFRWSTNTRRWNYWKNWLSEYGAEHVKPGDGLRFTDYNQALQAAIAGQGFIIGSKPILHDVIEAKLLVNPFPSGVKTDVGYDLVTTEASQARPEVAKFIEWITKEARLARFQESGAVSAQSC